MSLNNENSNLTPGVRSKGFTDDWERRKYSELASKFDYGLNAAATDFDGVHKYLRITDIDDASREFIQTGLTSPETDFSTASEYQLTSGDVVFARTGASTGKTYKYLASDGLTYFAGFLIRAQIKDVSNTEFFYQSTLTPRFSEYVKVNSQRSGQPGINSKQYAKYELKVPKKEEQRKIGDLLETLDHTIVLHQRKYDNLQQALHWTQQNLLPEPDSSLPKVRVGKFESDWTLQPLSEIIKKNNERNKGQFAVESTLSIATMRYKPEGNGAVQSSLDGYKVCRIGDIAFEGHTNDTFQYGRFILNLTGDGIISPRFTSFRFKHQDQVDIRYWKRFLHYEPVIHRILAHSTKLGTMMNEIMPDFLLKQLVSVPSLAEQQAIARVFTKLEERIQSEQALIENLKLVKKWALDNIFV